MKKLIITLAFVALSSVSAKAVDMGFFSITGGLATNSSVWGGSAKQETYNTAGTAITKTVKESGVFTESYSSQFIELGVGQWLSVGYEHTPDSISTPQNITRETNATEIGKVSVDFNDLNTTYLKLNLPYFTGMYAKYGAVEVDLDIKETMGSGSTYANKNTEGEMFGLGYAGYFKETGFGFRVEGSYVSLDAVSTDNGIAKGTVNSAAGSVNNNRIDAKNLEGLQAKLAVVYTFGKN